MSGIPVERLAQLLPRYYEMGRLYVVIFGDQWVTNGDALYLFNGDAPTGAWEKAFGEWPDKIWRTIKRLSEGEDLTLASVGGIRGRFPRYYRQIGNFWIQERYFRLAQCSTWKTSQLNNACVGYAADHPTAIVMRVKDEAVMDAPEVPFLEDAVAHFGEWEGGL